MDPLCVTLDPPMDRRKYRTAGDISNAALKHVVDLCKAGAKILDLCVSGVVRVKVNTVYCNMF